MKWRGTDGNIPDDPFCIVAPNTLQEQYMRELRRYLVPESFDLFAYKGRWDKEDRTAWWQDTWGSSEQTNKRIIVATVTVSYLPVSYSHHMLTVVYESVELDATAACEIKEENSEVVIRQKLQGKKDKETFIFGRPWCIVGLDEAHAARKVNRTFLAYRCLVEASSGVVAMTATPVQQSPQVCPDLLSYHIELIPHRIFGTSGVCSELRASKASQLLAL